MPILFSDLHEHVSATPIATEIDEQDKGSFGFPIVRDVDINEFNGPWVRSELMGFHKEHPRCD